MADEQNAGAAAASADAGAEGTSDNGQAAAANAGAQDQANDSANQDAAKAQDGAKDAEGTDDDVYVDDGKEEPAVKQRKSNADFIIARKNAKIEKLRKQQDAAKASDANKSDAQADDDDADDADSDDESLNLEGLAPIVEKHLESEDAQEVAAFLDEHPDFKPFEATVKRYMKHPSRRHLPVDELFFAVAGKNMIKMGAERERKAREKASQTQAGGGSNREDTQAPKDAWKMTPEEFEAEKLKVRQGR